MNPDTVRAACWTLVLETSMVIAAELEAGRLPSAEWIAAFGKAFTETFMERLGPDAADPAALPVAVEELAGAYMNAIVTLIQQTQHQVKQAVEGLELARLLRARALSKAQEN
jgi:hypothetical protein